MNNYVVAFDTANEMISLGIGLLDRAKKTIDCIASREVGAFRTSNVKLLPEIDALLADTGVSRDEVACVVCGRGPGSFTGVRICLASAKGVAHRSWRARCSAFPPQTLRHGSSGPMGRAARWWYWAMRCAKKSILFAIT